MESGEWREPRLRAGFRGTTRYVSIRVHRRCEQSPYDDLVSVMYTAYELLAGELPWKHLEKSEEVVQLKEVMVSDTQNRLPGRLRAFRLKMESIQSCSKETKVFLSTSSSRFLKWIQ